MFRITRSVRRQSTLAFIHRHHPLEGTEIYIEKPKENIKEEKKPEEDNDMNTIYWFND